MKSTGDRPPLSQKELAEKLGDEFLLSVDQAALFLAVSASTLNHWRSDGRGPRFVKLCRTSRGAIRYRLADLRAFVEANTFDSVAEAELAYAMSRVTALWDDWENLHPFIFRRSHFVLDSALADRETYLGVFLEPCPMIRWKRPSDALKMPWLRSERRIQLLSAFLASGVGRGAAQDIEQGYRRSLSQIPEWTWGGHPDLTLDALRLAAEVQPYPVQFGPGAEP